MQTVQWSWVRRGLRIGLATSAPVVAGVVLVWLVPVLGFGYPLPLLSLLLAGPLAAAGTRHTRRALSTALLAGWVAALVGTGALVFGLRVLGSGAWSLNAQASMAPMPSSMPQVTLLPTTLVTWAQQDILFSEPLVAVLLAGLCLIVRGVAARMPAVLPRSLNARLQLTVCALTGLTLLVGWVGFSALEDMHFRSHRVQLYVKWQMLIGTARTALDSEALSRATGQDPAGSSEHLDRALRTIATTTAYPGIALSDDYIRGLIDRYAPLLDAAQTGVAGYHANPNDLLALQGATTAVNALDAQLDEDAMTLVDASDAVHHANLFLVMLVAGLGTAAGLWVGQRSVASVSGPIRELGLHVARVAQGEFSGRVPSGGPQELQRLADDVNSMTADLDRLYAMERSMFQEKLRHQSLHDALTGLPNRTLLRDRVEHALARADHLSRPLGVLVVDLDNFKVINDSLGQRSGDALLESIADRLRESVRPGDTVARIGGDVFTLLVEDANSLEEVTGVADKLIHTLAQPIALQKKEVFVTASIGIAMSTPAHTAPEELLRDADLALHQAKIAGKARWEMYDESLDTRAVERLDVEIDMRRALERGEFSLDYQPIVQLATGEILEVEALVRWNHPQRGRVAPGAFIPVAEETGLIVPLGQWVLETACKQVRDWHVRYPWRTPVVMSVNLSGRQFQHPELVADIERVVRTTGLDPRYLKLEITESVLMRSIDTAVETLRALKKLDIQLAIDDFGTGYSSLSYLKQFPVDTLKIDRSFVSGLGQDAQDSAIVRSVVSLAKTLRLSVTGEGIETPTQQAQLERLGCDLGQGFLLARPATPEVVEELLSAETQRRLAA